MFTNSATALPSANGRPVACELCRTGAGLELWKACYLNQDGYFESEPEDRDVPDATPRTVLEQKATRGGRTRRRA